jgi:phage tail protein X
LCYRYYGRVNGTVEAVIAANQGLARIPQPFASGIIIVLPDLPVPVEKQVQLWS